MVSRQQNLMRGKSLKNVSKTLLLYDQLLEILLFTRTSLLKKESEEIPEKVTNHKHTFLLIAVCLDVGCNHPVNTCTAGVVSVHAEAGNRLCYPSQGQIPK